ncbi:hypothetical protein NPA07_02330 [Mycoplasmopsis caviae]|uniref:ECF transporter S component n=1 Tax=Mycoplasmopsis caviae TaxID=55603 RepID=A0A3P8L6G2_9BACT|nr:ECF transporter S component [Mycoplasmopsis caviae]UUD35688.1 hypothetical protein NPA07_02330 [Mycoplasmopsis caviae]VDR41565.1 Uncharacterised protein [Mycoplasmopsis caviae]
MEQNKNIYYGKNIVFKIVTSGILLALAIVVNVVCSSFARFPLAPFLKFDFSIVIILFAAMFVAPWSALIIIIFLALIGPSYGTSGYDAVGLLGHFTLAIAQTTFVFTFYIFNNLLSKIIFQNTYKKQVAIYLVNLSIAIVLTSTILTFINVFIITPWYFKALNLLNNEPATISSLIKRWGDFKKIFLNINNYFLATSSLFSLFNIINLSLNSILIFIFLSFNLKIKLWKIADFEVSKQKFLKNLFIRACFTKLKKKITNN